MRKKMLWCAAAACAVVALESCAHIDAKMKAWEGRQASDLLATLGPPGQTMTDGQGGTILVYSRDSGPSSVQTKTQQNWDGSTTSKTAYTPAAQAWRMFWVDADGRIYRTAWRGLGL